MENMTEEAPVPKVVRPDTKHRIALGRLAEGVSSFTVERRTNGVIVLSPQVEVPADEAWLWKNKAALKSVLRGIAQSERGELEDMGDLSKHLED
jgi:hypothetical protein